MRPGPHPSRRRFAAPRSPKPVGRISASVNRHLLWILPIGAIRFAIAPLRSAKGWNSYRTMSYIQGMIRIIKKALDEIATLPETDQEAIGRQLLIHVEKLRRLREEVDRGIRSLDTSGGRELDIEAVIRSGKDRHGRH